ncbi:Ubiquitin C-terminal hydrolases superfamily protein [Hibiscus syriacus]|uniref:Ubiquitin C-terminal hydrolases superfamily protein n=1 Tax=Hibiscus syriacus TaxID=106335 RepID=A0A6A3CB45_HIBSY|nr:Ubiquitin C-terminal hydrolases superfamily protein [Hibiscus syriacus]
MNNFINLWLCTIFTICYCYSVGKTKIIPKGTPRLLCFLPVVCLFLYIPLEISSLHLGFIAAFFITWLASFKLLLFAFGKGPLSSPSLFTFLALVATMAVALLNIELEKQFNKPYLSTSMQDFWGRRWNIMATSILQATVYEPVCDMAARFIDCRWAPLPAVFETFFMSGIMYELIFYYLVRERPTWEITWSYLIHGAWLAAEVVLKKAFRKWLLPRVVSTLLTLRFLVITASWLFYPPVLRCKVDKRLPEEYAVLGTFLKNVTALTFSTFQFQRLYIDGNHGSSHVGSQAGERVQRTVTFFLTARFLGQETEHYSDEYSMTDSVQAWAWPTQKIMWFFLLHGACSTEEIAVKKLVGEVAVPLVVSMPVGFVLFTCFWLFFPLLLRCRADERMLEECTILSKLIKNVAAVSGFKDSREKSLRVFREN